MKLEEFKATVEIDAFLSKMLHVLIHIDPVNFL